MSKVKWNDEQLTAIRTTGKNVLVSAGAGSGKTTVMIERVMQRILAGDYRADQILALTFTRAAAAEIKLRLKNALEQSIEDHPEADLETQILLLPASWITTIDSFCLRIVRENFEKLSLDPDFRIANEEEITLMRANILEELLKESYETIEDFDAFVERFARGKKDDSIIRRADALVKIAESHPDPEAWLRSVADAGDSAWMEFAQKDRERQLDALDALWNQAYALAQETPGLEKYAEMYEEDRIVLDQVIRADSPEEFLEALDLPFKRKATIRNYDGDPDAKEAVSQIRDHIKKTLESLKSDWPVSAAGEQPTVRSLEILSGFALRFLERFSQKKRARNVVDFVDLEHFVLQLFYVSGTNYTQLTETAERYRDMFREILIDEYQDSNLVQEMIVRALASREPGKQNLFMVGDVKQSIYSFRMARPQLFLEKLRTYGSEGENIRVDLNLNYRSDPALLQGVNQVFDQLMGDELGGIDYQDHHELRSGRLASGRRDAIELLLTPGGRSKTEDEAYRVGARIQELVDPKNGFILTDKNGEERLCRYSDIVILMRSVSTTAEVYSRVFAQMGIPVFSGTRSGYFSSQEVQTVLSVLKIIDNPDNDIPLAAAMLSPWGGFNEHELARIAGHFRKQGVKGSFYQACRAAESAGEDIPAELAGKITAFFADLTELRGHALIWSLYEVVQEILDHHNYRDLVSAMPDGDVRRANLSMLAELALTYEKTSFSGLFSFIRYIERIQQYNVDYGEAERITGDQNLVEITTIHKSKGLEYPVVILAGLGRRFNQMDSAENIVLQSDWGAAVDGIDIENRVSYPSLRKCAFRRKIRTDELAEQLRILYVAMTRAREKLILSGVFAESGETMKKMSMLYAWPERKLPYTLLSRTSNYLEWIMMSLARPQYAPQYTEIPLPEDEEESTEEQAGVSFAEMILREPVRARSFDAQWNYRYPFAADAALPRSLSISEIKKMPEYFRETENAAGKWAEDSSKKVQKPSRRIPAYREPGTQEEKGTFRGDAYHKALYLLPVRLYADAADMASEMEKLRFDGKLSEKEYDAVEPQRLFAFFDSTLGRRMISAAENGTLRREQPFVLGIPADELFETSPDCDKQILLRGIIDACFEEEGEIVLLDYRTDRLSGKNIRVLEERYAVQLKYYAKALTAALGMPVKEKILYSLDLDEAWEC